MFDVLHETPDMTPRHTSPQIVLFSCMYRTKYLAQHHVTPHRRREYVQLQFISCGLGGRPASVHLKSGEVRNFGLEIRRV